MTGDVSIRTTTTIPGQWIAHFLDHPASTTNSRPRRPSRAACITPQWPALSRRPRCPTPSAPATTRSAPPGRRSRSTSAQEVPYLAQNAAASSSSATRPSLARPASEEAALPFARMGALLPVRAPGKPLHLRLLVLVDGIWNLDMRMEGVWLESGGYSDGGARFLNAGAASHGEIGYYAFPITPY